MLVTRYQPTGLLNQVHSEMNRFLESYFGDLVTGDNYDGVKSSWTPSVDIKEEDERYVLYADLPGIDPADIEVTAENGVLSIKGERAERQDEDRRQLKRVERARGIFYRRFALPDSADPDRIQASGRNGVLEVSIPKHERVQPRKIQVQA